jgi:hypothetical protein
MSRAVLAVVMCGSNGAVADDPHFSATPATLVASAATSAAFRANIGMLVGCSKSVRSQVTGVLWPTPRGSIPITS